jgi:Icc-related predicted phosphoesterase
MKVHYVSDLHLETQEFPWRLPRGDVLIIAGDLAHAACLVPARTDPFAVAMRARVKAFAEQAVANFAHVLLIAGNHDHYDGVLEDTAGAMRSALPGVTVLDDEMVEIDGVGFFGTTLWSDFEGGSAESLERARRGAGEFFFVKTRAGGALARFRPQDALAQHRRSLAALQEAVGKRQAKKTVVISHHAPSLKGLNPAFVGNGLDGAYGSDLDGMVEALANVPVWIHGHTHIKKVYRVGDTVLRANCRGFEKRGGAVKGFSVNEAFEI